MKNIGELHVITDTACQTQFTHLQLAELAIKGGADTIQFRQKDGTTRELVEIAQQMQIICTQHNVPLIVNDRADIALAVKAKGAHFGQDDMPVAIGRKILSPESIIGASARTEEKILKAIAEGADYIGFGPIFQTSSKTDAEEPKGLERLSRISEDSEMSGYRNRWNYITDSSIGHPCGGTRHCSHFCCVCHNRPKNCCTKSNE